MACRTEREGYLEAESETLQDIIADNHMPSAFFKTVTFENVGTARKLLKKLEKKKGFYGILIKELKEKIDEYETWIELDNLLDMEVR